MFFDTLMSSNLPLLMVGYDKNTFDNGLSNQLSDKNYVFETVHKKNKSYGIEDILQFKEQIKLRHVKSAKINVYVFEDADSMSVAAQNSLLTLLENLPEGVFIIILVGNIDSLLETIKSRCKILTNDQQHTYVEIDLMSYMDLSDVFKKISRVEDKEVVISELRAILSKLKLELTFNHDKVLIDLIYQIHKVFIELSTTNISYRFSYEYVALLLHQYLRRSNVVR